MNDISKKLLIDYLFAKAKLEFHWLPNDLKQEISVSLRQVILKYHIPFTEAGKKEIIEAVNELMVDWIGD
jgi:hypothetical protein